MRVTRNFWKVAKIICGIWESPQTLEMSLKQGLLSAEAVITEGAGLTYQGRDCLAGTHASGSAGIRMPASFQDTSAS